jgi:pyrimidine operon attenuation protein/uracil phosphoribosyltransferase
LKIIRKSTVMDSVQLRRTIMRIAHEIVERNRKVKKLILVGIRKRGVPLAERIACFIEKFEGISVPVGALDITLYRDDVNMIAPNPIVGTTEIGEDVNDRVVVLIDDVLFTGRTVRAALDELIDFGRPIAIQLAVLIDRGHREFPIRADFVGKNVPTASDETVEVLLEDTDGEDRVVLGKVVENEEGGPGTKDDRYSGMMDEKKFSKHRSGNGRKKNSSGSGGTREKKKTPGSKKTGKEKTSRSSEAKKRKRRRK